MGYGYPASQQTRICRSRLCRGPSTGCGHNPPASLPSPSESIAHHPHNPSKVVSSASAGLAAGADMYVRSRRLETPDSLGVCTSGHADGNKQGSDAYGHDHQSPPDCGRLRSEAHSEADGLTGEIVQMDKRTDGKKANVNPDAAFHNQRGRKESLADDDAALAHLEVGGGAAMAQSAPVRSTVADERRPRLFADGGEESEWDGGTTTGTRSGID